LSPATQHRRGGPSGSERNRASIDKEVDMRPIGNFAFCLIALASSISQSQTSDLQYPAPTIHNSGQRASAIPLPPLTGSGASTPHHAANASWVGGPPQVAPASYTAAEPAIEPAPQRPASELPKPTGSAVRTPLKPPQSESTTVAAKSAGGNTLQMLLSVGSSLLIVIGLFLGVAWCYRKSLNTSMGGIPKQVVSVLGRTAIAPRQQLVLVRFGSKLVLVSLIQGETRTISEITDPLEVDQLAGQCESHQPHSLTNSFRSLLNQNGGGAL
jgi:flagellar protein FliO/FliZ